MMRLQGSARGLAATGLVLALAGSTGAARQREWRVTDVDSLLKGEFKAMSLTPAGRLEPGPAQATVLDGEAAYVWGLVPDGRGGVYAATGSDGRLYHLPAGGEADLFVQTFEYELFSAIAGPQGSVIVSGAPNGTILRVDSDRSTRTLLDLPEGVVWDMVLAPDGALYAAAGESGEIYRVRDGGESERIGRIPDAHVVALAWWQGRLLCGTDGRGLLAALDPGNGGVEILYDTRQEEVPALLPLADGRILFAGNGAGPAAVGGVGGLMLPPIEVSARGGPAAAGTSRLYERTADGFVRVVWDSPEQEILCLAAAPDGRTLVGTGSSGLLFALDERGDATRLLDLDAAQLLSLAVEGSRVHVGTGNGGQVVRLDYGAAREGIYTSDIHDAGTVAVWGAPDWVSEGQGRVVFETRSGQIEEPGELWSPWTELLDGRIASPAARYLQWRLTLASAADRPIAVRAVRLPFHTPNRPPSVVSLSVATKWAEFEAAAGGSRGAAVQQSLPGGVRVDYSLEGPPGGMGGAGSPIARIGLWARSLRSAAWKAEDEDGDDLRFDLYLRRLDEEDRLPLKLDLEETVHTWDAAAWPEGWYELHVVARDDPDQAPGEGLWGERQSEPFQIDNTPPRLLDLRLAIEGDGLVLSGRAEDDLSRIAALEYSLDGDGWKMAAPADRIFDSRAEAFRIQVPETEDGRRPSVVGVRVADEVGHTAAGRLRVPAEQ